MLMYEPNNSDAKQYAPLIDYMLAKEQSQSSDEDDDDNTSGKKTIEYLKLFLNCFLYR